MMEMVKERIDEFGVEHCETILAVAIVLHALSIVLQAVAIWIGG